MDITESLKSIRKQYKMTQEDVAKFLGISRSGYTYYETGKSLPSIDVLRKLAAIYDTTIDAVVGNPVKTSTSRYGRAGAVMEDCSDPLMYMKKEEQEIIMAYRLLSEEAKEKFRQISLDMLDENQD